MFIVLGHELTDEEVSSHRHLYVGFHLPGKTRHGDSQPGTGQHKHGHKHGHHKNKNHLKTPPENLRPGRNLHTFCTSCTKGKLKNS